MQEAEQPFQSVKSPQNAQHNARYRVSRRSTVNLIGPDTGEAHTAETTAHVVAFSSFRYNPQLKSKPLSYGDLATWKHVATVADTMRDKELRRRINGLA